MDRHFAQTQDCVCRKFALTEHTTGIGRDHPERKSDAPPRFGRTPCRTQAPTTAEKHTVTYTRRPIIRYTLKSASDFPVRAVRSAGSVSGALVASVPACRHIFGKHSATSTCKKYRCTIDLGTASNRKIMKNMRAVRSGERRARAFATCNTKTGVICY